jgi:DNA-binding beta-propeller fold protein YncE
MRRPLRIALTLSCLLPWSPAAAQVGPPVTPRFPNVPQVPGAILSGLNAPQQGRLSIIAYHNGVLFTVPEIPSSQPGADFQVRTWDITDPSQPIQLATLGITPQPINAHGYFKSGEYLVLGSNFPPEAPWSFRALAAPGAVERTTFPNLLCAGVRGCLFQPWFVGNTWWSYGEISGNATISRNFNEFASWDHLGMTGVVGHPFLLGDLLIFASDQSRTGVATYDVSDPTNPVLLDVLTTGGPGGYWPEIWGGDGKLYVVFPYRTNGNGIRIVDVTDPADLKFVTDRPLPGDEAMYVQFQDEYAFVGSHKVDLRTFQSVLFLDGANTQRPSDGGIGINTSQFLLPLGNLLVTGGIGPNEGMAIWAHQAAPDTRGPSVGYHIPQAGRTHYPVGAPISLLIHETLESFTIVNGQTFIVRPLGGSPIAGRLTLAFDDVLTFTPNQPLLPNTTYEVVLPAGGIKDAAGNGIVGYSFTFSTGGTVGGNTAPVVSDLTASLYPVPPGQPVTLTASASDPQSDPLEYRFDWGDGSPKTAWTASPQAAHAYAQPGHYRASVQVRDPSGVISTRTLTVTVLIAPTGPRPTASSSLACDAAARRVWVVNPDTNTLAAVHADSLTQELEVPVCDDPRSVARSGAGEIWVTCHDDDRIRVLSAAGAPLASLPTGYASAPAGIAFSPDGATAYVALSGRGTLLRFNAATRQQTGSLPLGPTPRAVAVTSDGARVLVTRFRSPRERAEVWDVAAGSFTLTRTLFIPKLGGEENRDTTASGRGVPNYLTGIAIAPDGTRAWVAATKPNAERGLLFGPDLDQDNTQRSVVAELDLVGHRFRRSVDVDNSDSPTAVAFSPLGDYLFVTLQGNNETVVLDHLLIASASGLGSFVTRLGTGAAPQGVCVDPVSERTFTQDFLGRTVTALETGGLFRRGEISLTATERSTVASETLPPPVLAGKRIFYDAADRRMSAEGYLSCASCHVDGGHDGRVWDFTGRGEGLRNTATLRGRAGVGQGNVHWSGNFDEIQDFENDVRNAFGGAGFMDDGDYAATAPPLGPAKAGLSADLDALATYVASLDRGTVPRSPLRHPDGSFTTQALAGRQVFRALDCGRCHAGAEFTDSTQGNATLHDVGTLRTTSGGRLGGALPGIDTPSLLGLWDTAPYFHDGSAETLEDVFRVAGGAVIPAETGAPGNGAFVVDRFVDLNNDDTVRGRAYVFMDPSGSRLTLSGVDGGPGGTGALEVRYSAGGNRTLRVTVNGVLHTLALPDVGNDPGWHHVHWRHARLEGVSWNPGTANTVVLSSNDPFPNISIDEVLVSTAGDLAAAQPHRAVLALPAADRTALLAYLRQLDGTPEENPASALFADGFESGDTDAWSQAVP